MLPYPATSSSSHHSRRLSGNLLRSASSTSLSLSVGSGRATDVLRQRSRVTNLALILILALLGCSLVGNFRAWVDAQHGGAHINWGREKEWDDGRGGRGRAGKSSDVAKVIKDTVPVAPEDIRKLGHLIVVAGHGIWTGHDAKLRDRDDQWLLEPYQRGGKTVEAIYKHIQAGSELAISDPTSLLIFSGGQTRPLAAQTEAQSYHQLALASSLLPSAAFPRVTTEDFALDSFQNLLFSIARFHEVTSTYPSKITVVGFAVKEPRFRDLHRAALRFPESKFHYVGIDMTGDIEAFKEGERKNGYQPFTLDPSGCHPPLSTKRLSRNPFSRFHPYLTSAPELSGLMEFCPEHTGLGGGEEGLGGVGGVVVWGGEVPWA